MPSRPHFFQNQQQLSSLPPELVYEIIYNATIQPIPGATTPKNSTSHSRTTFPTRINTLTNLSLTTHSLRNLIISSPLLWSEIEINIVNDVSCSPPLSFLKQLFERSGNVKMSVRLIHWGEEYLDFNRDKRVEWSPGVTRQLRQLLENNERNIEKLYLEFHQLNGTEYSSRPAGILKTKWRSLKHIEMYSSNWSLTRSMPMDWVESILETACPETVVMKGSGVFGWQILGGDMSCLRKLAIETEISESLAIDIIARTPNLEECSFKRLVQVSRTDSTTRTAGLSETIELTDLKKLRVGSLSGSIGSFLNALETPALLELEIDFVETRMMGWDNEAFGGFIHRSRLNSSLRRLAVRRGVMPERKLEECMAMFSSDMTAEWLS